MSEPADAITPIQPQTALVTSEQLAVLEKAGFAQYGVAQIDGVTVMALPVDRLTALLVEIRRLRKLLDLSHVAQSRINITLILEDLLERGRVVLLSPDGEKGFVSSCTSDLPLGRRCWSKTLEGVVDGLTDHPRVKVCIRKDTCQARGRPQPLSDFPGDSDSADGHASVCKECESHRVTKYQNAKKAKKALQAGQDQKTDYRPDSGKKEEPGKPYGPPAKEESK